MLALTLLMALESIRSVIWFTLVALMLVPVALDGVLKPNVSAMRFGLLNRALVLASLAGVIAASATIAAKPSSWATRQYPNGVLTAVDRVQAAHPGVRVFANEIYTGWLLLERPELKGRLDVENGVDSREAQALQQKMSTFTPDQMHERV